MDVRVIAPARPAAAASASLMTPAASAASAVRRDASVAPDSSARPRSWRTFGPHRLRRRSQRTYCYAGWARYMFKAVWLRP